MILAWACPFKKRFSWGNHAEIAARQSIAGRNHKVLYVGIVDNEPLTANQLMATTHILGTTSCKLSKQKHLMNKYMHISEKEPYPII